MDIDNVRLLHIKDMYQILLNGGKVYRFKEISENVYSVVLCDSLNRISTVCFLSPPGSFPSLEIAKELSKDEL